MPVFWVCFFQVFSSSGHLVFLVADGHACVQYRPRGVGQNTGRFLRVLQTFAFARKSRRATYVCIVRKYRTARFCMWKPHRKASLEGPTDREGGRNIGNCITTPRAWTKKLQNHLRHTQHGSLNARLLLCLFTFHSCPPL